jgi:tRNA-Thr(GGU) m(6)t(6)A37 methyltransferase TsaA
MVGSASEIGGAPIAGKPAPTGFSSGYIIQVHHKNLWELACQRWRQPCQHQTLDGTGYHAHPAPASNANHDLQRLPRRLRALLLQGEICHPRQPQLAPAARGVLELVAPFDQGDAVQGLEQVSHVWLLFLFHQALEDKPRLKVRPPRLGGNKSMGVFATRATHRPNGIGQSVVKLDKVEANRLFISGIDLLDGTPILDIKPYVPYADIIPDATNSIASAAPQLIEVQWTDSALKQAHTHAQRLDEPSD